MTHPDGALETPDELPVPIPDAVSQFFWDGLKAKQLLLQVCGDGHWVYPAATACPYCGGDLSVQVTSGRGTLYSFATVNRVFHPAYANQLPYIVALVELDEAPGALIQTNLVETENAAIAIGDAVEVRFVPRGDQVLALFAPATSTSTSMGASNVAR